MSAAVETHVGPNQRPRSDRHQTSVQDGAVEVYEDALADAHVRTVIDVDRRVHPRFVFEESFIGFFCRCGRRKVRRIAKDAVFRGAVSLTRFGFEVDSGLESNGGGSKARLTHSLSISTFLLRVMSAMALNRMHASSQRLRSATNSGVKA